MGKDVAMLTFKDVASRFKDMAMLMFYNPILFRRINAKVLKNDALFMKEILKGKKFPSIVDTKLFNLGIKLKKKKILKDVESYVYGALKIPK